MGLKSLRKLIFTLEVMELCGWMSILLGEKKAKETMKLQKNFFVFVCKTGSVGRGN